MGYLFRWPARTSDALVLSTAFLNSGNFGLSIVLFSFGEQGLELATIFFVVSNFVCNTVAAFFAARGRRSTKQALLQVLKLPGPYAFLFALPVRALKIPLPPLLTKPISLIGQASVPIMLMMLGLQLSQTQLSRRYREISIGVFLRLCVGALVAIGLASAMHLEGLARQVAIVEASTPTAVSSGLMAIEFDADSEYVTSVIFFSTLLSSITLTLLLSFLG
ncbi:MAG: AEC family transporter [Anaerolineae bacterium]|nr:AEC family transporter [Anaerolineae bacterium]